MRDMANFSIRISSDELCFSAAHFITAGHTCERLHGHNYRVAAEIHGPLGENRYVIDFIAARDALRAVLDELDHRVLLPGEHPTIRVSAGEKEVEVAISDRRWVFPRDDCLILPLANTTAEELARYLGGRLQQKLQRPVQLQIEVEESPGMTAVWRQS